MKEFFEKHSYNAVRLFLNQVVIGIMFGFSLSLVAGKMGNDALRIGVSIFSVLFYLFLEFTVAYKLGTEDRVSVDLGKKKANYLLPVWLWLLANLVNLILAIFVLLGNLLPDSLGNAGGVCASIALVVEGMYTGLMALNVGGQALNSYPVMYFVITLPALVVIWLSYVAGLKSKKIAKMFQYQYPESDRPDKKSGK